MKIRYATNPNDAKYYTTEENREHYLIDDLYETDFVKQTKIEGISIIGVLPKKKVLSFETKKGILITNVSGIGVIKVEENEYTLDLFQTILIKANSKIEFKCVDEGIVTRFLGIEANHDDDTQLIENECENKYFKAGYKTINYAYRDCYIKNALQIYSYFDLKGDNVCQVFGRTDETRHIYMKENEVFISPSWSINFSYGTQEYKMFYFILKEEETNIDIEEIR